MAKVAALSKRFSDHVHSGSFPWTTRIFLCLAVLAAYAGAWSNEFVYDERYLLINNVFLRHGESLFRLLTSTNTAGSGGDEVGFYRPVQMGLYFLIYQAFGFSTVAFHALNIILQAVNACLLHHFGVRAGFKKGVALAAALLWALHPLHTSIVSYISSLPELLQGCFCLLGLITLLPDFAPRKIWQAMVFFVLALGCKESAVVFPALAAATFFFVSKDRAKISAYLKLWPLWLISLIYIIAWIAFMHKTGYTIDKTGDAAFYQEYTANFINRLLTCLATLPVYARFIVWPTGLHIERDFPIFSTLKPYPLAGLVITGLGLLQIFKGRQRALSFGLLWFAIALSPYTSIVYPVDARLSEGWLYMPTMGLFLGIAQTAAGFLEKRRNAARLLACAAALSLGIATFLQNETWRNDQTLWQNTLDNGGYIDRLSYHAGLFNLKHHNFDLAAIQFQYLLDHPDNRGAAWSADVHMLLAVALLQPDLDAHSIITVDALTRALPSTQHINEAVTEFGKCLQDDPNSYWAHKYLATIYRYQGNTQMAEFHEKKVSELLQRQPNPGP